MQTGIKSIDSMTPIGRRPARKLSSAPQDRQDHRLTIDTILNQKGVA